MVKTQEIDAIRNFLNDFENVQFEQIQVNTNDWVRITRGPLMNQEGNVLEVQNQKIIMSLPSLGFCMVAEVSKNKVQVIHHYNNNSAYK